MNNLFRRINAAYLRFVALSIPPCHKVTRLLSQGMDRPLPLTTRLRLRVHLLGCKWCRRYETQLRTLRIFARYFPERGGGGNNAPGLSAEARVKIEAALRNETWR